MRAGTECPRCPSGSIVQFLDRYGNYETCIQCGYIMRDDVNIMQIQESSKLRSPTTRNIPPGRGKYK